MEEHDPNQPAGSTQERPGEHRRHQRNSMLLQAVVRLESGYQALKFRVRNISASGLMGEAPYEFAPGTMVTVELRNVGVVPATVAWSVDGRFGLAFLEQIDPARVRQMPVPVVPAGPLRTDTSDHVVRRPLVIGKDPPREPVPAPVRLI